MIGDRWRRITFERKVVLGVDVVMAAFLVAVGFILAHMQREFAEISPGEQAPVWMWLVWIGYAITIALYAYACAERSQ